MCMTLNQKADEWVGKHWSCNVIEMNSQRTFQQVKGVPHFYERALKQAYIDGAIENGIQWHDLRKDPNDLPKDDRFVIGVYKVTPFDIAPKVETCCYSETLTGWSDIEGNSLYNEIERWFDPQFKE